MARELRSIVWVEALAVFAVAAVPWPATVPFALPLVIAGTASRWVRGRTWAEVAKGRAAHAVIGAVAGIVALVLAVGVATRGIASLSQRSFEWSEYAVVRGNVKLVLIVSLYVAVTAVAAELALRGWLVERVLELSPGENALPILVGALAEAVITPGDIATRVGAGLFGAGLGWLYIAGGRSVLAPVCARVAFQTGALVLEALRVVG
ncbi:MAG: CPBP family glutamic-type intramembrane protease [Kofleriaceae bacterium]